MLLQFRGAIIILLDITLDYNMANQSAGVFIAVTMIHEAIHAEIFRQIHSMGGTFSSNDWPQMFDAYEKQIKPDTYQHDAMADLYRNTIILQ